MPGRRRWLNSTPHRHRTPTSGCVLEKSLVKLSKKKRDNNSSTENRLPLTIAHYTAIKFVMGNISSGWKHRVDTAKLWQFVCVCVCVLWILRLTLGSTPYPRNGAIACRRQYTGQMLNMRCFSAERDAWEIITSFYVASNTYIMCSIRCRRRCTEQYMYIIAGSSHTEHPQLLLPTLLCTMYILSI